MFNQTNTAMKTMMKILAVSVVFFSFAPRFGGEHYQIHVNNALRVQQIIAHQQEMPSLTLTSATLGDITVFYDHCGQIGKNRSLTIQTEQGKAVKTWSFINGSDKRMALDAKEVIAIMKRENSNLKLIYTSAELPKGRELVALVLDKGERGS